MPSLIFEIIGVIEPYASRSEWARLRTTTNSNKKRITCKYGEGEHFQWIMKDKYLGRKVEEKSSALAEHFLGALRIIVHQRP